MAIVKIEINLSEVKPLLKLMAENRRVGLQKLAQELKNQASETINRLMDAEISLFLGSNDQKLNKRNGVRERHYALKGVGSITVRIPRDRNGEFSSVVIPSHERMDPRIREDIAILELAGLSNRTLSMISRRLLGIEVGKDLVNDSLKLIQEEAEKWLVRPLSGQDYWALFVDGTNFRIQRRGSVEKEPSLIVLGYGADHFRSLLAVEPGTRENKEAWTEVFRSMIKRGLDPKKVKIGIMDGLPGLESAFQEAFPNAVTQRCWVHAKRNAMIKTPKRLQKSFSSLLSRVMYADSESSSKEAFLELKRAMGSDCHRAIHVIEKDLTSLLAHYKFPQKTWNSLKTTNAIERVNKELKRRTKSMETLSDKSHLPLMAFTALKLEMGWRAHRIDSPQMNSFPITQILKHSLNNEMTNSEGIEKLVETLGLLH